MLKKLIKWITYKTGKFLWVYLRLCKPRPDEFVEYLKIHGGLQSIGDNCAVNRDVRILDPYLVRLGNNVVLSTCIIAGHDGSIAVLNRAYNLKLDGVGSVDIKDNVFVGIGAIILPGVTIGPNAIVTAGSVVSRDVPPNSVVGGVPARKIGDLDSHVENMKNRVKDFPWAHLIEQRDGSYDPELEPELRRLRKIYFWGEK